MKNVLLFAFLVLSINAFAQSNQPIRQKLDPATNTIENLELRLADMLSKTPAMKSGMRLLHAIQLPVNTELTVLQMIDSTKNWVWDDSGVAWVLKSKNIHFVYDSKNNMTSQTEQNWSGSAWVDTLQSTYTYDAGNNPSVLIKSWTGTAWVNSTQILQTYSGKNLLSISMQMWAGNDWMDFIKSIYTYDANSNLLNEVSQWLGENSGKTVYTYVNNNMTGKEEMQWNAAAIPAPAWESSRLYKWEYDGNKNKTKELVQYYVENVWTDNDQTFYTYVNNKLTTETSQQYDGSNWMNWLKIQYTYTGNNKTKETGSAWDGSAFTVSWQHTFTYDDRNNLIGELDEQYDGSWKNWARYINTYDANNNQTSKTQQDWDGSTWRNTLLDFESFDANSFTIGSSHKVWNTGGDYALWSSDSTHVYFHTVVTGIAGIKDAGISVYPNPSRGKITLSSNSALNSVEIYSLTGIRIYADFNLKQQTSNEIDLTGYAKGIYILKVHNGTKIYISKVVIQ